MRFSKLHPPIEASRVGPPRIGMLREDAAQRVRLPQDSSRLRIPRSRRSGGPEVFGPLITAGRARDDGKKGDANWNETDCGDHGSSLPKVRCGLYRSGPDHSRATAVG